uniref:disabled homolog 2-interacting protein-like n=1 Tax=Myxine glutinosa TaxID=7769 RepID=UPI00358F576B
MHSLSSKEAVSLSEDLQMAGKRNKVTKCVSFRLLIGPRRLRRDERLSGSYDTLQEVSKNRGSSPRDASQQDNHPGGNMGTNSQRIQHELKLWVLEAKGLPGKGIYSCQVDVDGSTERKETAGAEGSGMVFWGAHFEYSEMGAVRGITVKLVREKRRRWRRRRRRKTEILQGTMKVQIENKTKEHDDNDVQKKRRRKSSRKKNSHLGSVTIAVEGPGERTFVERWYPLSQSQTGDVTTAAITLRIKWRHRSLGILPTERYKGLMDFLSAGALPLCRVLEPGLNVRTKDELARSLVRLLHAGGHIKPFLADMVWGEVEGTDPDNVLRQNTLTSKAVEAYLRLVGSSYLTEILGPFVNDVCKSVHGTWRLEPEKCGPSDLRRNRQWFLSRCQSGLDRILDSIAIFPQELREVFSSWRVQCEERGRPELTERLVSASLFLRLLCPALVSPSLFDLAPSPPTDPASNALTRVACVVQRIANFSSFSERDKTMVFVSSFVDKQSVRMHYFLADVSSAHPAPHVPTTPQSHVDLGRELSCLHSLLAESLLTNQELAHKLGELPRLLKELNTALVEPGFENLKVQEDDAQRPGLAKVPDQLPQNVNMTRIKKEDEQTTRRMKNGFELALASRHSENDILIRHKDSSVVFQSPRRSKEPEVFTFSEADTGIPPALPDSASSRQPVARPVRWEAACGGHLGDERKIEGEAADGSPTRTTTEDSTVGSKPNGLAIAAENHRRHGQQRFQSDPQNYKARSLPLFIQNPVCMDVQLPATDLTQKYQDISRFRSRATQLYKPLVFHNPLYSLELEAEES